LLAAAAMVGEGQGGSVGGGRHGSGGDGGGHRRRWQREWVSGVFCDGFAVAHSGYSRRRCPWCFWVQFGVFMAETGTRKG